MDTIIKTVKQYSYELNKETLEQLQFIANQYKNVKNYVYSRYSGINSISLLGKDRQIRNEWVKTKFARKYKGNIPYSKIGKTFSVDEGLYSYKEGYINITCIKKGQRLPIKLTDNNKYCSGLIIKIIDNKIEIHKPLKIQVKKNNNQENIIGIDKGYTHLFAVSSSKFYGDELNQFLNKETERLNAKNKQRNRFFALYNQYLEQGKLKKANTIKENNLGKVKYNHNKQKHDQTVKSYINSSLNQLIKEEKPTEIIIEQLDFVNWNDRYPKSVKRKLSRWIKGYIRERLQYKCDYNSIRYTYINPAYTSKVCSNCGRFGKRERDVFTCPKCGEIHSDYNASKNILNRKYDKEITLYTSYKKVKEILENRISY